MGFKALVTLDLSNTTTEERKDFYEILIKEKWGKIKTLTTSWNVEFNDSVTRNNALLTVIDDLKNAKKNSNAGKVDYAIQLHIETIKIGDL